jgi:hypothetical protein
MPLILRIINKIDHSRNCLENPDVNNPGENSDDDAFHFFVLLSCPLRNGGNAFVKMPKALVIGHSFKPSVNFTFGSERRAPFDKVILKDTFMKLVENVGGYAREYVGMGEVGPKWVVNRPKAFVVE